MALTKLSADKIKPQPSRKEHPDGGGLYLVVQPSGTKSWCVRYGGDKARRKVTLGPYLYERTEEIEGPPTIGAAHTLTEARAAAKVIVGRVVQGADPARERAVARAPAPEKTLDALFKQWKRSLEKKRTDPTSEKVEYTKRSAPEMFRRLDNYVLPTLGSRRIDRVTKSDFLDLWDHIAVNHGPVMANRCFETTRLFLNWCVGRDAIETSPLVGATKPRPDDENRRKRTLSDAELRAVWNAAGKVGQPYGPLVRLLILTGQRRGEVAGMNDSEITGSQWTLEGERTKNGQDHIVPLTPAMLTEIASVKRIGEAGLVFTTNGKTAVSGWSRWKRSFDAKCGVSDWTLHDLRRTAATGLQRLGVPLQVTEAVLNHTSGSRDGIVGLYQTHDYANEKRIALQVWNRFVVDIVANENAYGAFNKLNDVERSAFDEAIRADDKVWSAYIERICQPEQRKAA